MKKAIITIYVIFFLALLSGCVTIVEKTGQVLDGSAFTEKKIARYKALKKEGAALDIEILEVRNKKGQQSLVIMPKDFPAVKIRGTEPDIWGNFWVNSLEYLSGNTAGWNEYSLELSGTGVFTLNPGGANFSLDREIEEVQIAGGKIRRYDTRIVGAEAQTNLRNRAVRIDALTEWMLAKENAQMGLSRKDFNKYWRPILFPEIVAKRKRPAGWSRPGDTWGRAEDLRWNHSYSEREFPEELWPVRNSGTFLRDWEEAFEWIYLQYEWETLSNLLSLQTTLKRVK